MWVKLLCKTAISWNELFLRQLHSGAMLIEKGAVCIVVQVTKSGKSQCVQEKRLVDIFRAYFETFTLI